MPTANRGLDVAGLTLIRLAADVLVEALGTGMDPGGDPAKAATKAISDLGKHIPPGSMNPSIYQAALMKLMNKQRAQSPMLAAMQAQGQRMPQPGAGGAPTPPAAPSPTPMPQAA